MSAGNMSASHPQYAAGGGNSTNANSATAAAENNNNKEQVEDCRDYLRTGRCKYGASCKYNHPPNVQSGGGMKMPLNPTEPMFPIRPNEPICQYFLKHGTCKFGQACKFHHPPSAMPQPQYANAPTAGPSPVLLGVTQGRKVVEPATQFVAVGPPGADLTHMMVQFLPQRPEEPDCIYFLKNGRCKYGATCRYHHPVQTFSSQSPQTRPSRQTRGVQNDINGSSAPKIIPYISQQPGPAHPPRKILVASEGGGPVSFMGVDQNGSGQASYKPASFLTSGGELISGQLGQRIPVSNNHFLISGSTVMTEQGSSASSIASSFDTGGSSMDLAGGDAATAALWSRSRKNGSGNSLNAFEKARGPMSHIPNSASDGNIAMRSQAAMSVGNSGEYYQATYGDPVGHSVNTGARASEWRNRSSSFDQQIRRSNGYPHEMPTSNHQGVSFTTQHPTGGRPPMSTRSARPRQSGGNGDEGFTMMTSALLNMLDTQEETSAEAYSEDESAFITGSRFSGQDDDIRYCQPAPVPQDSIPSSLMENLTLHSNSNDMRFSGDGYGQGHTGIVEQHEQYPRWSQAYIDGLGGTLRTSAPMSHYANGHQLPTSRGGGPCGTHSSDYGVYLP